MARGRARGSRSRGRGNKSRRAARVISSDEEHDSPKETGEEQLQDEDADTTALKDTQMDVDSQQVIKPPVVEEPEPVEVKTDPVQPQQTFDMEADISQLEAPTFTTISRGPPEPMLHLQWNHKVNLIGEKVLNPMIYCCDQCEKPILVYGRMIPCKHVFCLKCARNETLKVCPRCKEKAIRVEQTGLGTIFMCTHGGTRYENKGCRRTYLSQRDLQAHINHRHVSTPVVARLESLAVKITEPTGDMKKLQPEQRIGTSSQGRSNSQSDSEGSRGPGDQRSSHFGSYSMRHGGSSTSDAQQSQSGQRGKSQYYR